MRRSLSIAILALALRLPVLWGQASPLDQLNLDLKDFPAGVGEQIQQAYDAARANPNDPAVAGKLGMLLELYKRPESAAVFYDRARKLDPAEFKWPYFLGSLQSFQGKRAQASATLREALRLNPDYLPARLKLAENLLAAGDWEEAAGIYGTILKERPDVAEAHYGIGKIRAANGDLKAAMESYRKACELFPAYGAAHYGLGLAYRKLGDAAKSEEQLKLHAANQNLVPPVPDPVRDEMKTLDRGALSLLQRGIDFQEAGRIEEAIAEHEKALELDPDFVPAHSNLIILYGRSNQPQKAEEHYRAAVRINPNHANSYYNYGVLLSGEKRYAEAEAAFQKAIEANPFHAQALHNLGIMKEQQGHLDDALELYRRAVERQPDFPLAHFHMGRILVNQKKYDEAVSQFKMALNPEDESTPAYLYALSATYARAGNRDEALKTGRQAREKASARGQTQLLLSIDKLLQELGSTSPP